MTMRCPDHGSYEGWSCPHCDVIKKTEQQNKETRKSLEEHKRYLERSAHQQEEALDNERREAEYRHEQLIKSREREIHLRSNPGDYKCEACLYITLRRGASRCPQCHADVNPDYWQRISESERIAEQERLRQSRIAAEEWAKGEPERLRQAAKQRKREQLRKTRRYLWYGSLAVPAISTALLASGKEKFHAIVFAIPYVSQVYSAFVLFLVSKDYHKWSTDIKMVYWILVSYICIAIAYYLVLWKSPIHTTTDTKR